jgi:hypothetical protein
MGSKLQYTTGDMVDMLQMGFQHGLEAVVSTTAERLKTANEHLQLRIASLYEQDAGDDEDDEDG